MKIIVTGSLGHISQPLTKELLQKEHDVVVISSKQEKQEAIEALGASAAIGSLEDEVFLTATFNGADAVYTMVPPNYTESDLRAYYRRLGNNYALAIRQTGVKRVVNLSSYGADLDHGTGIILGAHDVENILNDLENTFVTHLRPTYFYYNLYNLMGMIKAQGIMGSNYGGEDKLAMVAPADIAAVAAEELTRTGSGKDVRYITSDDLTCNEIAQILGDAIGKPDLKWLTFTDEQMKEGLLKNGMPEHFADSMVELGASIHNGILRKDFDKHQPTIGKVKLQDFAKEFAKQF